MFSVLKFATHHSTVITTIALLRILAWVEQSHNVQPFYESLSRVFISIGCRFYESLSRVFISIGCRFMTDHSHDLDQLVSGVCLFCTYLFLEPHLTLTLASALAHSVHINPWYCNHTLFVVAVFSTFTLATHCCCTLTLATHCCNLTVH